MLLFFACSVPEAPDTLDELGSYLFTEYNNPDDGSNWSVPDGARVFYTLMVTLRISSQWQVIPKRKQVTTVGV